MGYIDNVLHTGANSCVMSTPLGKLDASMNMHMWYLHMAKNSFGLHFRSQWAGQDFEHPTRPVWCDVRIFEKAG